MIGAPTLDPRQGDRRQKALNAAVQSRLSAMGSGISRFAKTGFGKAARTGVGTRPVAPGGGRPSGVLNFLSPKDQSGFGPGGVNFFGVNPGLGSLPDQAVGPPTGLPGGPPYRLGPDPGNPLAHPGGDRVPWPPQRPTGPDGVPTDSFGMPQFGPAPSGMIPLGGGVFYDPETGVLRGSGIGG